MDNHASALRTHLEFMARSCELYDQGHTAEALRLAVSLRVIFHDTISSTSVLTHLNKRSTIRLASTFATPKSAALPKGISWHTVIPLMLTSSSGVEAPATDWIPRSWLIAVDWWQEVVWLEGDYAFARKDIVLSAANQDGGAHVDGNPSAKTRKLKAGPAVTVTINGKTLDAGLPDHHFPLLRQFSHEVLNSPEIRSIAAHSV